MTIDIKDINEKISIAGNGIVGLMTAYFNFLRAKEQGKAIKISVKGKYSIDQTTSAFLVPSISWNELLSVVPPGKKLLEALEKLFTEFKGGIRIEQDDRILREAKEFIDAVKLCSDNDNIQKRTELLIEFGKLSISLWDLIYELADNELRDILIKSNYLPCRELSSPKIHLRDGYRLEINYDVEALQDKLQSTFEENRSAGYQNVQLISPDVLLELDPSLQSFCEHNSIKNEDGTRQWKPSTGVILRPGGCINTPVFLNEFANYLTQVMGTYINEKGKEKPCFRVKLGEVTGLEYAQTGNRVVAFQVDNKSKAKKREYEREHFILCPGESIGTLRRFGLFEPPHARFGGFSLKITVPEQLVKKAGFDLDYKRNMAIRTRISTGSVVQVGRFGENFTLGIGGMKVFLGLDSPNPSADYAIKAAVCQLNMLNKVYAPLISVCFDRNTQGIELNQNDLEWLIQNNFATPWAGARACIYDGAPTIDYGHNIDGVVNNLIVATHLSSGGVTNSPGTAFLVHHLLENGSNSAKIPVSQTGFFSKIAEPKDTQQLLAIMNATRGCDFKLMS